MRRRYLAGLIVLAGAGVVGCGSEDFPNDPRPPAPVELSAKVDNRSVVIAPALTGAGLATVTISNQSSDPVELEFSGPSKGTTNEISAGGVGTLRMQLEEGDYQVEPSVSSIRSAKLEVGAERPTAQNDLLLP